MSFNFEQVARIAYLAVKALSEANGDQTTPDWDDAPEKDRVRAITGVTMYVANPHSGPEATHNRWMAEKKADGWTHGPEKHPVLKEHPLLVPFEKLAPHQQMKNILFCDIVASVRHLIKLPF